MNTFKEAFDNSRRTTDSRTTRALDIKPPPRRSSYSFDGGVWNMLMGKPKTIKPTVEKPKLPSPEEPAKPEEPQPTTKKQKYRQPNLPKFPRIPKTKVSKEIQPKFKKTKSKHRQLSLKLKESQLFLESYYNSLNNSK